MNAANRRKLENNLSEAFRIELAKAVKLKFNIEVETRYNIFSMNVITDRVDNRKFSMKQKGFIEAFELGYLKAQGVILDGK